VERRTLGRSGIEVGVVGLGTEHLVRDGAVYDAVLGEALEAGANYVDLLYVEPEYWEQFGSVYRAHREGLVLAGHWSSGSVYDLDYCRETFDNMLAKVGNDHIEVAMMTMIDDGDRMGDAWRKASLEALEGYRRQGRIDMIAASAHGPTVAREAVESGLIELLMFPVNMLGEGNADREALYTACVEHDVALVAMKVYNGGTLIMPDGEPSGITPAQCMSYTLDKPVAVTVPGPRTLNEWRITLAAAEEIGPETGYANVTGLLTEYLKGHCTYCNHCEPCPEGLQISWLIWPVDNARTKPVAEMKGMYMAFDKHASDCVQCGICLERCPFDVDIMSKWEQAIELFGI